MTAACATKLMRHKKNLSLYFYRYQNRIVSFRIKSIPMADAAVKDETNAPNLIEKVKDEIESVFNSPEATDGIRSDIDKHMALDDVKAPNVFERVKEAIVETVYAHRDEITGQLETKFNLIAADSNAEEKTSEPIKKETHGTSNDIDADTPIDAVKAPNVLQRAKEEFDALVQTVHLKKEPTPETEGGFRLFIAKLLQTLCHPGDLKKD